MDDEETKPEIKDEEKEVFGEKTKRKLKNICANPLKRCLINLTLRLGLYTRVFMSPSGWEALRDPELRMVLLNRKYRIGLLENAIISNPLYVPNNDGNNLSVEEAIAGRYVALDWGRKDKLPNSTDIYKGRIFAFPLDEIINNSTEKKTPTSLFDILDIQHALHVSTPSITQLCEQGLLRETTYAEAYQRSGIDKKYLKSLQFANIDERKVFQVTPKGNTLIVISKDGGDKSERKHQYQEKPQFQFT